MLDWETLDAALESGKAAETVNPDELFDLTRSVVYTTVADTMEKATGRLRSPDLLMIVDSVYSRLCAMSSLRLAAERLRHGDALKLLHGLARDTTMDYVRAVFYPKMPLSRILGLMGADAMGMTLLVDDEGDPLDSTQRVVLMMRHGEGLSSAETANALGVSRNEIRTIEHRAHQAIEAHLMTPPANAALH